MDIKVGQIYKTLDSNKYFLKNKLIKIIDIICDKIYYEYQDDNWTTSKDREYFTTNNLELLPIFKSKLYKVLND